MSRAGTAWSIKPFFYVQICVVEEEYPDGAAYGDEYGDGYDQQYGDGDDYEGITPEDCWTVITSFFDEKGLVRQQLDSFDEFIQNTMQELIDENSELVLDQGAQYSGTDNDDAVRVCALCVRLRYACTRAHTAGNTSGGMRSNLVRFTCRELLSRKAMVALCLCSPKSRGCGTSRT